MQTVEQITKGYYTESPLYDEIVTERFYLDDNVKKMFHHMIPIFGYGYFGEFIFYRTYSRMKEDGTNETWNDCVIRITEGVFSIRKDWYKKCGVEWNIINWQAYAKEFAISLFNMHWTPPGRGLWAMGTPYVYKRGSMALYNCAFVQIRNLAKDIHWLMDVLMNGVGVGFEAVNNIDINLQYPSPDETLNVIIGDDREGWCESVKILIESYQKHGHETVIFDYSNIRLEGLPIKGFGGLSSGPEPLKELHNHIRIFCSNYVKGKSNTTRLIADLCNVVGCCVVAGNVRRSAEIAVGDIYDQTFLDLKDYKKNPEREHIGWMSNNSARLKETEDFEQLPMIAKRVIANGEPGFLNMINIKKYGRVGKDDGLKEDKATGVNPCGEIPLENHEVCNLAETYPTRCNGIKEWYEACEYATFYCSTVSLLATHRPETNTIVMKNRRIGVGIVDFSGWKHINGVTKITKWMREGYKTVRRINRELAEEAGVPESIRVTTVKPGGTVPKLAGRTSGVGHPTFIYTIRRVRVQDNSPIAKFLQDHNVPNEKDKYSANTLVFEFPIKQGPAKPAQEVKLWEQAMNVVLMQREWADNAVSNTLYFNPETETDDVEPVLASIAPLVKSISLLPHNNKVYEQMPEEGCTEEEYQKRLDDIKHLDWSTYSGTDGLDTKFCDGEGCDIPIDKLPPNVNL